MAEDKHYFVGIKFKGTDKSYYFSTDMSDLKVGDLVVVETVAGYEIGTICTALMDQATYNNNLELKPILRKPTSEDLSDYQMGLEESERALKIAEEEIKRLGLPMHLLEANYTLDGSKVTITYTSENRVDFRELLRILAPQLKCRIELRQIASRDKAKMVGGIGICGLPLCCSTFLDQFDGISISRAKNQMLTLNIPKLSGPCGKLICCLLYEDDAYTEAKKEFPRLGQVVHLEEGDYTIVGMNILNKQIKLSGYQDLKFLPLDEVNEAIKNPKGHRSNPSSSSTAPSSPRPTTSPSNANPNPTPTFKAPNSNNGQH
jgi:cell fate regulator YaaT (PSP1 superfamily)